MVKIRLSRAGARNRPYYHVVVVDERKKRDGRPLAVVGSFDPKTSPKSIKIESEAIAAWVAKGAQLSPTVKSLMRRAAGAAAGSA
jgi:small subunit ribosomal protein S16